MKDIKLKKKIKSATSILCTLSFMLCGCSTEDNNLNSGFDASLLELKNSERAFVLAENNHFDYHNNEPKYKKCFNCGELNNPPYTNMCNSCGKSLITADSIYEVNPEDKEYSGEYKYVYLYYMSGETADIYFNDTNKLNNFIAEKDAVAEKILKNLKESVMQSYYDCLNDYLVIKQATKQEDILSFTIKQEDILSQINDENIDFSTLDQLFEKGDYNSPQKAANKIKVFKQKLETISNCLNDYLDILDQIDGESIDFSTLDQLLENGDYNSLREADDKIKEFKQKLKTMLDDNNLQSKKVIEYDDFVNIIENSNVYKFEDIIEQLPPLNQD